MSKKHRNKNFPHPISQNQNKGITGTPAGPSGVAVFQATATSFSGLLPPPQLLKQYGEVLPDAPERILKMAESQSNHRQGLEKTVVRGDSIRVYLGIVFGFLLGGGGELLGYALLTID